VPPWPSRSHMTPLTLTRLERPQGEARLTHLAEGKALPAEVVAYLVARTDGGPLCVEELTKRLLESDVLPQEAERYTLTGPLSGVAIPTTLQDSLMARLDRLPMLREVGQPRRGAGARVCRRDAAGPGRRGGRAGAGAAGAIGRHRAPLPAGASAARHIDL